jgi:glycosyltransferase involved in cell wall biosynthesis
MPFIEPVLRNVEPYMDRMLITISEKSNDGTLQVLRKLEKEFSQKMRIDFENVDNPGLLTQERQKQVEKTSEDWILFADDDDWWSKESLEEMMTLLDNDVDGYAVSPYQVIDENNYDKYWLDNKFFSKWFRNKDIKYKFPWPKDLIFTQGRPLYWKQNPKVTCLKGKFFHLSNIKSSSFRQEDWASQFKEKIKRSTPYPDEIKKYIWEIFDWKATH